VRSRSQVDVALRLLTKYELLDRTVHDLRPPVASYCLSKRGKEVVHHVRQLEEKLEYPLIASDIRLKHSS